MRLIGTRCIDMRHCFHKGTLQAIHNVISRFTRQLSVSKLPFVCIISVMADSCKFYKIIALVISCIGGYILTLLTIREDSLTAGAETVKGTGRQQGS